MELLTKVGIPDPRGRMTSFPHEFSGGMRQRVMIAIAMANDPAVIICDEPTTALDVTVQAQVLELLKIAHRETGAAIIMITHDLGVVAGLADDLLVMYAGRAVEAGTTEEVFANPSMPYTMGLIAAVPRLDVSAEHALATIPGRPPNLVDPPTGCTFAPRCPLATEKCEQGEPDLLPIEPGSDHSAACVRLDETVHADAQDVYGVKRMPRSQIEELPRSEREVVLAADNLERRFELRSRMLKRHLGTVGEP